MAGATACILEDDFQLKNGRCPTFRLTLKANQLSWTDKSKPNEKQTSIELCDLLNSEIYSEKGRNNSLRLHYVKHHRRKTEHRLSAEQISFLNTDEICEKWRKKIHEHLQSNYPQRPKRLLVLINPVSGKKSGPKVYSTLALPIFQNCGIEVHKIETEKAHHIEEILSDYDLNSIDGIVAVGGDGTYGEVIGGLAHRAERERQVDINDPEYDMIPLTMPVGIIATGTGNGIVDIVNTTKDQTTAVLLIALGDRIPKDIATVHEGNKFRVYSVLLTAAGMLAEAIRKAETNRSMGRARYAYGMLYCFIKQRVIEVEVDYLPVTRSEGRTKNLTTDPTLSEKQKDSEKETTEISDSAKAVEKKPKGALKSAENETSKSPGWITRSGEFIRVDDFLYEVRPDSRHTVYNGQMGLTFVKPCGRIAHLRYVKKWYDGEIDEDNPNEFGSEVPVTEYRVRAIGQWRENPLSRYINVDGEILHLDTPDYSVKIHKSVSQLFTWPVDHDIQAESLNS